MRAPIRLSHKDMWRRRRRVNNNSAGCKWGTDDEPTVIRVGGGRNLLLTRLVVARIFEREHVVTRPGVTREPETAVLENANLALQKPCLPNTVE